MHVAQVSFFNDSQGRRPERLLEAWPSLSDVAEAVHGAGVRVSVVQSSGYTESLERSGVGYHFRPFGADFPQAGEEKTIGAFLGDLAPDVFHVHGLGFNRDTRWLARVAPGTPIVLQDHASSPPRIWRRPLWRRGMSVADGIAFCALEQAEPFARAGLIDARTRVYEIPESTSSFTPGDRAEARRATGIEGDPAVLWVGHLDANKDPLTILEAVSSAAKTLPGLRLYCCYATAPLLALVQARIASSPELRGRVELLGRVPHERIELLMRAADVFILGSHQEGSGYSLIEALACGLPPVVTDIPSFRSLTGEGSVGMLWPCDDSHAASRALQSVVDRTGPDLRAAVRAHFERELSSGALGSKLAAMYGDVVGRRRQATD